jgi:energy-coupling factor transporter ATP-binding protein EcfA2
MVHDPARTVARSAEQFIRDTIDKLAVASFHITPCWRNYGPIAFELYFSGKNIDEATLDRLFRFCSVSTPEATIGSLRLHVSVGSDGTLGETPPVWPFPVIDAQSFHRTVWSPTSGLALTSDEQNGVWTLMDFSSGTSAFWINDLGAIPDWEHAAPLRHQFHWFAHTHQAVVAHTAAFSLNGQAILVAGPGGSGKSTLSAAAAEAGLTVLAEDLCWVDLAGNLPAARRIYDSVKVTGDSQRRFPAVARFVGDHESEFLGKTIVRLPAADISAAIPIRAMFCMSGEFEKKTRIAPCRKTTAFSLLAPSTVFLMRTAPSETAARLKNLIDRVPVFHVIPGADPVTTAAELASFSEGLS